MERQDQRGLRSGGGREIDDLERLVRLLARVAAAEYVQSRHASATEPQVSLEEVY